MKIHNNKNPILPKLLYFFMGQEDKQIIYWIISSNANNVVGGVFLASFVRNHYKLSR